MSGTRDGSVLIHEAARMHKGVQRCRRCRARIGADWAERGIQTKYAPRWKPGQYVVIASAPPYRGGWALSAYPGDVSEIESCSRP